jgi:prepilin-type N-terminal cleavage/methylation domain-containing protein
MPHILNKDRRSIRLQSGFTLVEVMIALAIFAIGILAVSAMQITAINQNSGSRMQTEATALAEQLIERLMALPYDHDLLSADLNRNPHQQTVGAYTISWTVSTPDPADPVYKDLPVKMINITVNGGSPNARPVQMFSIRGQGA